MTMRKGKVFLKNTKQTVQDNPCRWFPLFLLRFPQEPGRYMHSEHFNHNVKGKLKDTSRL